MVKLVSAALGLYLVYYLLSQTGSAAAAAWLTGGLACVSLVWFGLSRA